MKLQELKKLAENGDLDAKRTLAMHYLGKKNIELANPFLKELLDAKDSEVCLVVGRWCLANQNKIWGVEEEDAIWYFKEGTKLKNRDCFKYVGDYILRNARTDSSIKKALSYYTRGAKLGSKDCMEQLVKIYYHGLFGMQKDIAKAKKYLLMIVEKSDGRWFDLRHTMNVLNINKEMVAYRGFVAVEEGEYEDAKTLFQDAIYYGHYALGFEGLAKLGEAGYENYSKDVHLEFNKSKAIMFRN